MDKVVFRDYLDFVITSGFTGEVILASFAIASVVVDKISFILLDAVYFTILNYTPILFYFGKLWLLFFFFVFQFLFIFGFFLFFDFLCQFWKYKRTHVMSDDEFEELEICDNILGTFINTSYYCKLFLRSFFTWENVK